MNKLQLLKFSETLYLGGWEDSPRLPNGLFQDIAFRAVKFESSPANFRGLLVAAIMIAVVSPQARAHGTHSSLMAMIDARLAESPADGGLWYQRAVLEFEHEDFAAAAGDFAKAEKFSPGEYAVLWWQGRIFDATGKTNEAKAAMDLYLAKTRIIGEPSPPGRGC